jgi:N-acetyl-anhydromuramyl-L-alanine amidase AmpD
MTSASFTFAFLPGRSILSSLTKTLSKTTLTLLLTAGLAALVPAQAAQPDYTNAIWHSAYPGHWYTTGSARAFVVEHDMEGYYLAVISYFQQSGTQASIHYCVNSLHNGSDDQNHAENNPNDSPAGEIAQMVEEQYWAWHVRCWNRYMLGTEHEGFVSSPVWYSDEMYQASGLLTRYLCDKYSIPKDRNHIIGHNEWQNASWRTWMTNNWPQIDPTCNDHTDPGVYWNWTKFMSIVSGAPGITTQPWSRLVEPGSNVTFQVVGTSSGPLNYQWRKDGLNLAGATQSTFSLTNVQQANAGGYSVILSNASGVVTSRVASLSISPLWQQVFSDNFETNTASNWTLYWGAGNGVADFTTNWAFNYGAVAYVANGVTNFIPPAPNSGSTTHGLKLTVNKNDATAATAGVSLYPNNLAFSNDYALRFDMWINYNGGPGGGTGSTEYGTFGLNHDGTRVNWTTAATSSDGLWFAVDGEGGSGGSDYRAYAGNGAAAPTQLAFADGGLAASGSSLDNAGDPFFHSLFPSPAYETAGAPGKHWVQGELSQINNVLTWQLNGVVVAQRTNTSAYTNGNVMIGYMDPFTSIANPLADNFVIFDNVRVLVSAANAAVNDLAVIARPNSALISWRSLVPTLCQIEYGPTVGYGNLSPSETGPRTNHSMLLIGLTSNTNYQFRIHSHIGANDVISSPFSFSTDLSLIIDNPQALFSGPWTLGTSSPGQYGVSYQYVTTTTNGAADATATYTPTILTPGKYDVFIWYPAGTNRSANVPIYFFSNNGYQAQAVDQRTGGGVWRLVIPALDFAAGNAGSAVIGNNTGEPDKLVMADAFRWAYTTSQDIPTDGTVPAWWSSYYFGTTNVDAALDPDHDGYTTYVEYVMGTDPTNPNSRFATSVTRVGNGLQLYFSPWQGGRTYQLQSATNLAGPWIGLPDAAAVTNGQGVFSVTNSGVSGPRFYRIAVRLTP